MREEELVELEELKEKKFKDEEMRRRAVDAEVCIGMALF